jgi:hypothetical protein
MKACTLFSVRFVLKKMGMTNYLLLNGILFICMKIVRRLMGVWFDVKLLRLTTNCDYLSIVICWRTR